MRMTKIGIIGGSGLDDPDILKDARDRIESTAWGEPSSPLKCGSIGGVDVMLLARHGRRHTIPPSQVNYRANVRALAQAGCTHILATTAVGSLREEIGRGDLVILDQFIDFTRRRVLSYHESFEPHQPKHAPMAEPFSAPLREALIAGCRTLGYRHHPTGTVVTIEGPRFSTRAESRMFRLWGADVINMSIAPEAILANEAGLPYAAVAMSTDYDCWKEDEAPVSWDEIIRVFSSNAQKVTRLLASIIPTIR
jgi:5'-methylthioadenosine phosphorylase